MFIPFVYLREDVVAREEQLSQLFSGLSTEEIERRRAALVLIRRRFASTLSMGAFQYVGMAIECIEQMICERAVQGEAMFSESEVRAIEDQAVVDRKFEAQLAKDLLQQEQSIEFQESMAKAYGFEPTALPPAAD